jgi:hypothetical protein
MGNDRESHIKRRFAMRLSERGAIKSALADGGFHLYPAGRLIDIIKESLAGDDLTGDFSPTATPEKVRNAKGPESPEAQVIFRKDVGLLADRLTKLSPEYDIDAVFERMMTTLPMLARRYYSLEGFEPTKPVVVEYFFEGINDMYKDADWSAFNMSTAESKEMNVPVGIYFKRNQVSPGIPEFVVMHEANHAMQEHVCTPAGFHHYIPWMDEGFADAFGRMMLFRATEDESMLAKLKNFRTDVEVTNPWKFSYHFDEQIASMTLMRGRLPFCKALMRTRQREPFSIDWNMFARLILAGIDPHVAIVKAYCGSKLDAFKKKFERDEKNFRGDSDLDQMDLRVLSMFSTTQAPATLSPNDYAAALWIAAEAERHDANFCDPDAIPQAMRDKIPGFSADKIVPMTDVTSEMFKKAPEIAVKALIAEDAIPSEMKASIEALGAKFYIVKRKIGETTVFEPYGGGLPYRLGAGEIRCTY